MCFTLLRLLKRPSLLASVRNMLYENTYPRGDVTAEMERLGGFQAGGLRNRENEQANEDKYQSELLKQVRIVA